MRKIIVTLGIISLSCLLIAIVVILIGSQIYKSQANIVTSHNFPLKQKWVYEANEDVDAIAVSPTGQLVIQATQSIASLKFSDGQLVWSNKLPKTFGGSAPVVSNNIVVVAHSGGVNAYDLKTGKQLWQDTENRSGQKTFVADTNNDVVVIVGGFIGINELKTGKLLWLVERNWPGDSAQAVIDNDKLYIIFSSQIRSYNIKNGELNWTIQTPLLSLDSLLFEDGILYLELQSNAGVAAFDTQARKVIWQQKDQFETYSQPITKYGNYLFTPIHDGVPVALNVQNGDILWQAKELPADTYLTSLVVNDIVYVKNMFGRTLYALDLQNGTRVGELNLGFQNILPPVIKTSTGPFLIDDSFIVFADNERVLAYEK